MAWGGEGRRITGPFAITIILGKIGPVEQSATLFQGMQFQANLFL